MSGGIDQRQQMDRDSVRIVLSQLLNRFARSQPSGPTPAPAADHRCRRGRCRPVAGPGRCVSVMASALHQRDAALYQFMNSEITG